MNKLFCDVCMILISSSFENVEEKERKCSFENFDPFAVSSDSATLKQEFLLFSFTPQLSKIGHQSSKLQIEPNIENQKILDKSTKITRASTSISLIALELSKNVLRKRDEQPTSNQ